MGREVLSSCFKTVGIFSLTELYLSNRGCIEFVTVPGILSLTFG